VKIIKEKGKAKEKTYLGNMSKIKTTGEFTAFNSQ